MTNQSRIQAHLKNYASNPLLSGEGDTERARNLFLANGLDGFLSGLTLAAVADGLKRKTVMNMFITHAVKVLEGEPGSTPRENIETVLRDILHYQSLFDDYDKAS